MTQRLATNFNEMVDLVASEDPVAAVLGWWCRVEKALAYYTTAYHGRKMGTAIEAIRILESDARVSPEAVARLHTLRRQRNAIAHGKVVRVSFEEAKQFASEAWDLGWLLGDTVPNPLAISSGAALVT